MPAPIQPQPRKFDAQGGEVPLEDPVAIGQQPEPRPIGAEPGVAHGQQQPSIGVPRQPAAGHLETCRHPRKFPEYPLRRQLQHAQFPIARRHGQPSPIARKAHHAVPPYTGDQVLAGERVAKLQRPILANQRYHPPVGRKLELPRVTQVPRPALAGLLWLEAQSRRTVPGRYTAPDRMKRPPRCLQNRTVTESGQSRANQAGPTPPRLHCAARATGELRPAGLTSSRRPGAATPRKPGATTSRPLGDLRPQPLQASESRVPAPFPWTLPRPSLASPKRRESVRGTIKIRHQNRPKCNSRPPAGGAPATAESRCQASPSCLGLDAAAEPGRTGWIARQRARRPRRPEGIQMDTFWKERLNTHAARNDCTALAE